MPYFIESDRLVAVFPKQCAYCQDAEAASTVRQPFSKLKMTKALGAKSDTRVIDLPACPNCSLWFRYTEVLLHLAGVVALTGLLWVVLASAWFDSEIPGYIWIAAMAVWAGLRIWRSWRQKALQLAYFSDKQAVYEVRDEDYAKELAELNGLAVRKKRVLVKLS